MIHPVILSGGGGTRLWPLSRTHFPKQYWKLAGSNTLIQDTAIRVVKSQDFNKPMIICHNEHRFLVAEQLREVGIPPSHIVLETMGHNTAASIAIACLLLEHSEDQLLIMPADHVVENTTEFHQKIRIASEFAQNGKIVTFGIVANTPETRYGYIQKGKELDHSNVFEVSHFREKPNLNTAKEYIDSGNYYWNSGIFLFKANTMIQEFEHINPTLLQECRQALSNAKHDLDFLRLDSSLISEKHNQSIDYVIMEHTKLAIVIAIDLGWSDVGSWDALWEIAEKDRDGNVTLGDVITHKVRNSYIRGEEHQLLTVLGLDDVVVVSTQDAILIAHKNHIHDIKEIVYELKREQRTELDTHTRVYRPWGYYQNIDRGDRFQVKRLMVKPGGKTSTQIHFHRSEHWVVVSGTARVTRGDETILVYENQSVYLPMGTKHRVENPGKTPLHFIEVQSGSYLGEDDIIRLEDSYGRADVEVSVTT